MAGTYIAVFRRGGHLLSSCSALQGSLKQNCADSQCQPCRICTVCQTRYIAVFPHSKTA